tara:strand:+ start:27 stop:797 length:771 start_codon:yes stop_codon:yes gene_type:complete
MDKFSSVLKLRDKLSKGLSSCGSWQQIPNNTISEILASEGYEWISVDLEHGSIDVSQLPNLFCALEAHNVLPFARLSKADSNEAHRVLEAGAAGIIFPMIRSGNQINELIKNSIWPPNGNRGVGFSRASLHGKFFEKQKQLAEKPFLVAMIESFEGMENIKEIIKNPYLDAIMIGPYDLSASLGVTGDFNNEKYKNALKTISTICNESSMPMGIHIIKPSKKEYKNAIANGYQFIAYSTDALFILESSQFPGGKIQ